MKVLKSDSAVAVYQLVGVFAIAPLMIALTYLS